MYPLWKAVLLVVTLELSIALLVHILPRLGSGGRKLSEAASRAPLLDVVLALMSWVPWLAAGWLWGLAGVAGSVAGQFAALYVWVWAHELANWKAARGPRIASFLNRRSGIWRNHLALWVTMIALPGFWVIRVTQILGYPFLVHLLGFPRYRHGEWINVSRQKFEGLVGHDLFWCLYCDWMTGVYSLGAEMLRNVESFWCPIRFYDGKKCENCSIDFPDIENGWVPAEAGMSDVLTLMESKYSEEKPSSWFGHPDRGEDRGD